MELLSTLISEVGKCLYEPIKRHCGYLFCYARNVETLSAEVKALCTSRDDIDNKLEEERRTSKKEPLQAVKQWKEDVENVARDANILTGQLTGEQMPIHTRGCCCPIFISRRYKLGNDAAKEIAKVKRLTDDCNKFGDLTYCPPPSAAVIMRSDTIQNTESVTSVEERVKQALKDDSICSIGIYGMGGIGKTTLVKKINNDMAESGLFDKIIMVTVSQNPDLKCIQGEIAERLGQDNIIKKVSTVDNRAPLLFNELKKHVRIIIILDDVWEKLELAQVGIPRRDEHPCCKILVTTRDSHVCDQLRMDIKIAVQPWSQEASRKLFDSKVGLSMVIS